METINRNYKKYTYELEFGVVDTVKTVAIDPTLGIKGEVIKLIVTIPNFTNPVTAVVKCINADSKEIFVTSPLEESEEYNITLAVEECIIMGSSGEYWEVELSGAPGSAGVVSIIVYAKG